MKGSSFGVIYNAFDSFERQMENALDGIFDEYVADSVAQSYQLIIGCNNTCIFMDDKKRKLGLSFVEKMLLCGTNLVTGRV